VAGDFFGGLLGFAAGKLLRQRHFERKTQSAAAGQDVSVRVRAHPADAPYWKYWHGAVVRRGASLRFRPILRRWRTVDLGSVEVLGLSTKRSAADGAEAILTLTGVPRLDHLAVATEASGVLLVLLRPMS
jgi:hypothetical protein